MARRLLSFDDPDRFVAGTIGPPGSRAFYLQARKGRAMVSVGLEKTQVAALATRILELLQLVGRTDDAAEPPADDQPLEEPLVELFRVGSMALSWDADAELVVVEAQSADDSEEFTELSDDADEGTDLVRIRVRVPAAYAFVRRAAQQVQAGRPTCPFCGQPLEAGGHFCPHANGHLN